jgi:predicted nucleic acid-binding protein
LIVVDASVLAPALVDDGSNGDTARSRLTGEHLLAPDLIFLEVVSAIRTALRQGDVDERRADFAFVDLYALPVEPIRPRRLLSRVWELRDNLSPYDASYVALAEAAQVVLVTADRKLTKAPGPRCDFDLLF